MNEQDAAIVELIAELSQPKPPKKASNQPVKIGQAAVPALLRALTENCGWEADPFRDVLRQIATATPELAPLVVRLKAEAWREQLQAVQDIGKLGEVGAAALPDLVPLLYKRDDLRDAVIATLEQFGPLTPLALHATWTGLNYNERYAAIRIMDAAARLGPIPETVKILTSGLHLGGDIGECASGTLAGLGLPVVGALLDHFGELHNEGEPSWAIITLIDMAPEVVPELIETLQDTNRDPHSRRGIICTVCQLAENRRFGPDRPEFSAFVAALIQALDSGDSHLATEAINGLAQFGPAAAAAVPRLIRGLDDPETRAGSLAALAAISPAEPEVVRQARKYLKDPDDTVRRYAESLLAAQGDDKTMNKVLAQLNDPDENERWLAVTTTIRNIMKDRPEVGVRLLGEALANEHEEVRVEGASMLFELRQKQLANTDQPLLLALADASPRVRQLAVGALAGGPSFPDDLLVELLRILHSDPAEEVRAYVAGLFNQHVKVRNDTVFQALRQALHDPGNTVRSQALSVLLTWATPPQNIMLDLLPLLEDSSEDIRNYVATILCNRKDLAPEEAQLILQAMHSVAALNPQQVNPNLLGTLGRLGYIPGEKDLPWLLEPIQQGSHWAGSAAIPLLARPGAPAVPELIALLAKSPSAELAKTVAKALGEIGASARDSEPALRQLLDRPETRAAAAGALGRIGLVQEAIAILRPLLDNKTPYGHVEAAQALHKLGPESLTLLPKFMDMVRDRGSHVAGQEMIDLLVELAGYSPEVITQLRATLSHPHCEVVAFAAQSL